MKPTRFSIIRKITSYHGVFPWFVCAPIGLCIMLCGLFSCEYIKHQSEIDSKLEEIALEGAKDAEEAEAASLMEDVKERAAKRESEAKK